MELKLSKSMTCRLAVKGKWCERAAAWMGLSFFLRMVYYFGFMNLRDIPGGEIVFCVILPLLISVGFMLVLKLQKLNNPTVAAGLSVAFAVNYFFAERMNAAGIISGILLLAMAGLVLAAVLGYVPERKWLLWAAMAVIGFRALFVDLSGYILPLRELKIIAYVPRCGNLFGIVALGCLSAGLDLKEKK